MNLLIYVVTISYPIKTLCLSEIQSPYSGGGWRLVYLEDLWSLLVPHKFVITHNPGR